MPSNNAVRITIMTLLLLTLGGGEYYYAWRSSQARFSVHGYTVPPSPPIVTSLSLPETFHPVLEPSIIPKRVELGL